MVTLLLAQQTIDPTLFAAAVVTVLAALGSGIVQIINTTTAARDRREVAIRAAAMEDRQLALAAIATATASKADQLITDTAKVHELTNSTNSNLTKALEIANEKMAGMERLMAQMNESRRTAAADRAANDLHVALLTALPAPFPAPVPVAIMETREPVPVVIAPETDRS